MFGFAVATVGFVMMAVGVAGANVVFFRSLPLLSNRPLMRSAPNAVFEFAFWLVAWAAVAGLGIATMLLGLVLTGGRAMWSGGRALIDDQWSGWLVFQRKYNAKRMLSTTSANGARGAHRRRCETRYRGGGA